MPELQTTVDRLEKEVAEAKLASSDVDEHHGSVLPTTTQFRTVPRSVAVPVTSRAIVSAPAAASTGAPSVPLVVSTPPPQ